MHARRESNVALLARVPVATLGLAIAASALHASCTSSTDAAIPVDAGSDAVDAENDVSFDSPSDDLHSFDAPSDDSPADRQDGMSYGDGYGPTDAGPPVDARAMDAGDAGSDGGACVSSTTTYPAATGCPAGNHTWTCWSPTPAAGGIQASHYTVLTLCSDVVVIDEHTHLMWGQDGEAGTYTWVGAAASCTRSRRAGFSDWRLPSSNELMSLVDYANDTSILNGVFKGNFPTMWSSTSFAQQAGSAWQLYASGGIYPQVVSNPSNVRCVR
jgi:hypothetical protein